jgi:tRNA (guanine26-N2/guanine27-N2)-dimethyltransferase
MAWFAAKHDIGIRILFSHSTDHYIRVYAQIGYGCQKGDESLKNTGYILHCFNCLHRETVRHIFGKNDVCPECGSKMEHAGPLWIGSICDSTFIDQVIQENQKTAFKNSAKITKLLTLTKNEAKVLATYYVIDKLSGKLKLPSPSVQAVLTGLKNSGFQAVPTHFNTRGIKTDAPALIMQKILKEIVAPK